MTLFFISFLIICFLYSIWKLKQDLHILQLNSYRNDRYWRWLKKNIFLVFHWRELLPFVTIWFLLFKKNKLAKKPLVFTARAVRLYVASLIMLLSAYIVLADFAWRGHVTYLLAAVIAVFLNYLSPFILIVVNSIMSLIEEKIVNRWYLHDAKNKLQTMPHLTVIGITGSFGKTTSKYVLNEILRRKYNVLMTPGSFNTPMGITKVIRSMLQPTHEIFIVEMSAKQKNDIAEICALVKPKFGMITAIGPQHLETFGNIEAIKNTKNELILSLSDPSLAFFNLDNAYCQELMTLNQNRGVSFGIDSKNLEYWIEDIKVGAIGSIFTVYHASGEKETFTTKLLGRHNIYNILAAISLAHKLGIKFSEMLYPIRQLNAVPHRLELKKIPGNITYIDDAFNSNPVGSKMALEVLANMGKKRKIIVTPGMIELGSKEYELNCQFGEAIAEVCDYVILVGKKQTRAIQEGLKSKKFSEQNFYIAKDFTDANQKLKSILKAEDVVLFENDLPDNYNE